MPRAPRTPGLKRNIFDGLAPWQLLLAILPIALLFVGGAIGGAIGAVAMLTNVKVAKSPMATPLKAFLMVGVILTAVVLDLAIAALISIALHG